MKINCIVLDDEPLAVRLLENYINNYSELDLKYAGVHVKDAIRVLNTENIDLVFIDIQMPEMTGVEFMENFNASHNFIVTSAYSNYALVSFDFHVVDYLLKPFSYARFCQGLEKYKTWLSDHKGIKDGSEELMFKSAGKTHRLYKDDIRYIEGLKDYVKIFVADNVFIVYVTMKSIEKELGPNFVRVHKSFIVNFNKILWMRGNQVEIPNQIIPIGSTYKKAVLERFSTNKRETN